MSASGKRQRKQLPTHLPDLLLVVQEFKRNKTIMETARQKFKLNPNLIDLNNPEAAQNVPCAFGAFCMMYNGEVVSYHPISNKRFENIMTQLPG